MGWDVVYGHMYTYSTYVSPHLTFTQHVYIHGTYIYIYIYIHMHVQYNVMLCIIIALSIIIIADLKGADPATTCETVIGLCSPLPPVQIINTTRKTPHSTHT